MKRICLPLLLLALIYSFIPKEAWAGAMLERYLMRRMPRYTIWGDIGVEYADTSIGDIGNIGDSYRFRQNYSLNLRSYIISPRLLYYDINTGYHTGTGTMIGSRDKGWNYGINMALFPYQPLSLSLRAYRSGMRDYYYTNYGLTLSYSRPIGKGRPLRMWERGRENGNNHRNHEESLNILPKVTVLNLNRTTYRYKDTESLWYNASLGLKGGFKRTVYFMNFSYYDYTNPRQRDYRYNSLGGNLETRTSLNWRLFQNLDLSTGFNRGDDIWTYNIASSLTGSSRRWDYGINGSYYYLPDGGVTRPYNISLYISRSEAYKYLYKGWELDYGFGVGLSYLPVAEKEDLYGSGRLTATKQFRTNTLISSTLGLHLGTAGVIVDSQTSLRQTFRPLRWLTVGAGYTLGIAKTTGWRRAEETRAVREGTLQKGGDSRKTLITHTANLTVDARIKAINFTSNAIYYYSDVGENLQWSNSVSYATRIMRRVNLTIGASHTMTIENMQFDGTTTTNYTVFSQMRYSPWRKAWLSVNAVYIRDMPADTSSIGLSSSLSWLWRSLVIDLNLSFGRSWSGGGGYTDRQDIFVKVTRPYRIIIP